MTSGDLTLRPCKNCRANFGVAVLVGCAEKNWASVDNTIGMDPKTGLTVYL